jgi:hypothetical protein
MEKIYPNAAAASVPGAAPSAPAKKSGGFGAFLARKAIEKEAEASDGFTPAWAVPQQQQPTSPTAAPAAAPATADIEAQIDSGEPFDPELAKAMGRLHMIVRICYMIAAIIMGAAAGVNLATGSAAIGAAFFCIYIMFFCLLICCFEVGLTVSAFTKLLLPQIALI